MPDLKKDKDYDIQYEKARGILELINSKRAETYSKENYKNIIEELNNKKEELYSEKIRKIKDDKEPSTKDDQIKLKL